MFTKETPYEERELKLLPYEHSNLARVEPDDERREGLTARERQVHQKRFSSRYPR